MSLAPNDFPSVLKVVARLQPNEIYNLAGQTSIESTATLNLLEVIRFLAGGIRFFSARSSECFGDIRQTSAMENTPLRPKRFVTQKIIEAVKAIKARISPATF